MAANTNLFDAINVNIIPGSKLVDQSVDTLQIANSAVDTLQIANDAIDNNKIANNAVGNTEILNDAVTGSKMAMGTITNREIGNGAVGEDEIANDSIMNVDINSNANISLQKISRGYNNYSFVASGNISDSGTKTILINTVKYVHAHLISEAPNAYMRIASDGSGTGNYAFIMFVFEQNGVGTHTRYISAPWVSLSDTFPNASYVFPINPTTTTYRLRIVTGGTNSIYAILVGATCILSEML
jgi:hypothetical protein